jgi:myo-inositol-1(or 4)-monophosphatase
MQLPESNIPDELQKIILATGEFMHHEFLHFDRGSIERKKSYKDVVSYVDKTAENMLREGCEKLIPGSGFIMEESGEIDADRDWRWIIDPLDGTTNFVHGAPVYSISLALQKAGQTVLGVVYDVERKEYFFAEKGKGAFLNGRPVQVSPASMLEESLMATGFPYAISDIARDYLAVLSDFVQYSQGVRRLGSAALDLAWVASGRLDGYYEIRLSPWDVAAGALLVSEAGGLVTDFSGTDNFVFGKQIVATNALIHEAVLKIIHQHMHI